MSETDERTVNHFRARVEILLSQRGWSVRDLAQAVGKSRQRTMDIIQRGDPKASVLKEFAEVLEVAPKDLLKEVSPAEYGKNFLPIFQSRSTN